MASAAVSVMLVLLVALTGRGGVLCGRCLECVAIFARREIVHTSLVHRIKGSFGINDRAADGILGASIRIGMWSIAFLMPVSLRVVAVRTAMSHAARHATAPQQQKNSNGENDPDPGFVRAIPS